MTLEHPISIDDRQEFGPNSWDSESLSSVIARGVVPRSSPINGLGLFTTQKVQKGETVILLRGIIFSADEVKAGAAVPESTTGYKEGFYIGRPKRLQSEERCFWDDYLNHSCDPNLWLQGQLRLVAREVILPDEELTVDYATWEIDEKWFLSNTCKCHAVNCRSHVSGKDWRINRLQSLYRGHFLPCIEKRISLLKAERVLDAERVE